MWIIRHRTLLYWIMGIISALSIGSVILFGLTIGIEFTGGTLTEVSYANGRPDRTAIETGLKNLHIGESSLRESGDSNYLLRTKSLEPEKRKDVMDVLSVDSAKPATLVRSTEIGPVIGEELKNKAWIAIVLVILTIILYITFVFRKVSEPVASWMYGVITVLVLLHDLLIPIGMFALLGHFMGAEVDVLFVVAVLTILGYSVNDTIVVFDRVRENLKIDAEGGRERPFAELVGGALMQTLVRSINTSVTTFLGVVALLFLGSEVTRYFALTLAAGVVAGTYSSILLASPLLVTIEAWQRARRERSEAAAELAAASAVKPQRKR